MSVLAEKSKNSLSQSASIGAASRRCHTHEGAALTGLPVGAEVFVEAQVDGAKQNLRTQFLGFKVREFIILSNPRLNGASFSYSQKRRTAIRYFHEGSVFGFETEPLRTIGSPFNLTFFKCPAQVEEVVLRREPRVQIVLPIARNIASLTPECMLNISTCGALLHLSKPARIDERFHISFTLPNGVEIRAMEVEVKRVDIDGGRVLAGVAFAPEHPQSKAIEAYISLVLERLAPPEISGSRHL